MRPRIRFARTKGQEMATSTIVTPQIVTPPVTRHRVRVFVDFWNFQLSCRRAKDQFRVDWQKMPQILVAEAGRIVDPSATAHYEGMHVYGSYDKNKPNDVKLKNWFTNSLDKMPGTNVVLLERQKKKGYPKCPHCQAETTKCHACGGDMRGTEEKGVDTRMATELISLAWAQAYDVAVLVSSDRDFVPVAEFLQTKGIKIVHGAFPPQGSQLSQKCWGNINLVKLMPSFERV